LEQMAVCNKGCDSSIEHFGGESVPV
jgi:hypothetical protein